jgi:hypothetical protein
VGPNVARLRVNAENRLDTLLHAFQVGPVAIQQVRIVAVPVGRLVDSDHVPFIIAQLFRLSTNLFFGLPNKTQSFENTREYLKKAANLASVYQIKALLVILVAPRRIGHFGRK